MVHPLLDGAEGRSRRAVTASHCPGAYIQNGCGCELKFVRLRGGRAAELGGPGGDFDIVGCVRGQPEQTAYQATVGNEHERMSGMPNRVTALLHEQFGGLRQTGAAYYHADGLDIRVEIHMSETLQALPLLELSQGR